MKTILVRTSFVALHCWPILSGAEVPLNQRNFLQYPHRHVFWVVVELEVSHGNRAVEFFAVQADLQQIFQKLGFVSPEGLVVLTDSCEDLAEMVGRELQNQRYQVRWVAVSEDGENEGRFYAN